MMQGFNQMVTEIKVDYLEETGLDIEPKVWSLAQSENVACLAVTVADFPVLVLSTSNPLLPYSSFAIHRLLK